ncbi:MAG: phosphate acetyltransferase [Clostridiales bacterium]|jgi:phosphate acetyltransferase|nr:phosphate acetyltransferase [Clostridiales bacterium]
MGAFIDEIKRRAREDMKTIVLPESDDERVVDAARQIEKEGFANVILLTDRREKADEYARTLFELRKEKGMTERQAAELMQNPLYYAVMMVKMGDADGMVAGAAHSTSDTFRPALQILKTAPGSKLVSAFFIMFLDNKNLGENGVFAFGDCGMNPNPNEKELAEIAIATADSFKMFIEKTPKVAMLSYSTYGSAQGELVDKVRNAVQLVREKAPHLAVDGEIQLDAAVVPEIAAKKAPQNVLGGKANVLIFPDLQAGNIGYKMAERFAGAEAYGPLMQGIAAPVNDLSRGCSAEDIVGVVALTSIQAQKMPKRL